MNWIWRSFLLQYILFALLSTNNRLFRMELEVSAFESHIMKCNFLLLFKIIIHGSNINFSHAYTISFLKTLKLAFKKKLLIHFQSKFCVVFEIWTFSAIKWQAWFLNLYWTTIPKLKHQCFFCFFERGGGGYRCNVLTL